MQLYDDLNHFIKDLCNLDMKLQVLYVTKVPARTSVRACIACVHASVRACVCLCACVHAWLPACVHACVRACFRARVCMLEVGSPRACYPATSSPHAATRELFRVCFVSPKHGIGSAVFFSCLRVGVHETVCPHCLIFCYAGPLRCAHTIKNVTQRLPTFQAAAAVAMTCSRGCVPGSR